MELSKLEKPQDFLSVLENRFSKHMFRHPNIDFQIVKKSLDEMTLNTIYNLEQTDGEPDVIIYKDELYFVDMAKETPKSRVSLCYDLEARVSRKKFPPSSSVIELTNLLGAELVDEELYYYLQTIEPLDLKTSSWLKTQEPTRKLGGAIFGDRRYNRVFTYHNSADSYYSSRGFRSFIKLNN